MSFDIYYREGSIIAVDLRGFSTFSKAMARAGEEHFIQTVPESLFAPGEDIVRGNGGRLLKEMGDGEFFSFHLDPNYPLKNIRQAAIASIRSGIGLLDSIEEARGRIPDNIIGHVRDLLAEEEGIDLNADDVLRPRVGIASGEGHFRVREVHGERRKDVGGYAMSQASRLEAYGTVGGILVDQRTRELAGKRFDWKEYHFENLKGVGSYTAYIPLRENFPTFVKAKNVVFGREEEIEVVKKCLKEGGKTIVLRGPPGIGKTTIADQALGRLYTTIEHNPSDRTDPLSTLRNFYKTAFQNAIKNDPEAGIMRQLEIIESKDRLRAEKEGKDNYFKAEEAFPYVGLPLGLDAEVDQDSQVAQEKLKNVFHKLRAEMFEFVMFDDVQWMPPLGYELLRSAPDTERNVATARPEFDPDFPVDWVEVDKLGEEHIRKIFEHFLGNQYGKLERREVNGLVKGSDGIPLHAKFRAIGVRRELERGSSYREAISTVPKEFKDLVQSQIQEFGADAFHALRIASHLNRSYVYRADLEKVAGIRLDDETLKSMEEVGIISLERPLTIEIIDDKVRDALRESTQEEEQGKIHSEWGRYYKYLEKGEKDPVKRAAYVLQAAEQYGLASDEEAVPYLLELGKSDRELGDTETSREHLRLALKILSGIEVVNTKEVIRTTIGELDKTLKKAGLYQERGELQAPNLSIIAEEEVSLRRQKCIALSSIGTSDLEFNPQKALRSYHDALVLAEAEGDLDYVISIEYSIGVAHRKLGDLEEAKKWIEKSLGRAEKTSHVEGICNAHNSLGLIYKREGMGYKNKPEQAKIYFDNAGVSFQLAFSAAQNVGNKTVMTEIKRGLADLEHQRDNKEGVIKHSLESLQYAREVGRIEPQLASLANIAYGFIETGRPEQAKPYLEEGVDLLRRYPVYRERTFGKYIQKHIDIHNLPD